MIALQQIKRVGALDREVGVDGAGAVDRELYIDLTQIGRVELDLEVVDALLDVADQFIGNLGEVDLWGGSRLISRLRQPRRGDACGIDPRSDGGGGTAGRSAIRRGRRVGRRALFWLWLSEPAPELPPEFLLLVAAAGFSVASAGLVVLVVALPWLKPGFAFPSLLADRALPSGTCSRGVASGMSTLAAAVAGLPLARPFMAVASLGSALAVLPVRPNWPSVSAVSLAGSSDLASASSLPERSASCLLVAVDNCSSLLESTFSEARAVSI